jgi:membrane fusion protein (multidrug efflux system)
MDAASAALKVQEASVTAVQANLDQTKLSASTQIDAMQGRVESLRAAVQTAELNLEYGTIRAPISGRVGDSLIPVGGLVTPNAPQPLTTIVPLDPIWVRFKVTEPEYLSWSKSRRRVLGSELPLKLVLADDCDFPWPGHIENTLNQMDAKTGTLELQARFPNPQRTLLPGQFGRVRVQVEERKNALVVPQRAVQQLQNLQMVYTVDRQNRVEARPVTAGARVGGSWVIEKGLEAGDRVIVEGQLKVRPGAVVKPLAHAPPVGGPSGN